MILFIITYCLMIIYSILLSRLMHELIDLKTPLYMTIIASALWPITYLVSIIYLLLAFKTRQDDDRLNEILKRYE